MTSHIYVYTVSDTHIHMHTHTHMCNMPASPVEIFTYSPLWGRVSAVMASVGVLDSQPITVQARMLQEYVVKGWRYVET